MLLLSSDHAQDEIMSHKVSPNKCLINNCGNVQTLVKVSEWCHCSIVHSHLITSLDSIQLVDGALIFLFLFLKEPNIFFFLVRFLIRMCITGMYTFFFRQLIEYKYGIILNLLIFSSIFQFIFSSFLQYFIGSTNSGVNNTILLFIQPVSYSI